jgi:lipopolysaccharide transport system permease protein
MRCATPQIPACANSVVSSQRREKSDSMKQTANFHRIARTGNRLPLAWEVAAIFRNIVRNRKMVVELAWREITDVHAGQMGGAIWVVVHPLLLFCVYAFLFTLVFKVRIGSAGPGDYLIYLFAGLSPWLLTQDALVRSAQVMPANSGIVKKVLFPMEALVAKTMLASLTIQSILFATAIVYMIFARGTAPPSLFLLCMLAPMHLAILWGISLFLASLTPYFRDTPEIVRIFVTINIYMIPVMYLPDMMPPRMRFVLTINPFSHLIWCYQDVIYFNRIAHPEAWVVTFLLALFCLCGGSFIFSRLRHHITSVL